jgi:hypothetical protein
LEIAEKVPAAADAISQRRKRLVGVRGQSSRPATSPACQPLPQPVRLFGSATAREFFTRHGRFLASCPLLLPA